MKRTALTDDGVRIEYDIQGPLTLFFQHGWGNAADSWDHILSDHLDLAGLRCIAASYCGHGGSDKATSGYPHAGLRSIGSPSPMPLGLPASLQLSSAWPASSAVIYPISGPRAS